MRTPIHVETTEYSKTHGEPSGFSWWRFRLGTEGLVVVGEYADSVRRAKDHARAAGLHRITLLPNTPRVAK